MLYKDDEVKLYNSDFIGYIKECSGNYYIVEFTIGNKTICQICFETQLVLIKESK